VSSTNRLSSERLTARRPSALLTFGDRWEAEVDFNKKSRDSWVLDETILSKELLNQGFPWPPEIPLCLLLK
jgi:hypothetical protein